MFQIKVWNYHGGGLGKYCCRFLFIKSNPYLYKPYPLPSPNEGGRWVSASSEEKPKSANTITEASNMAGGDTHKQ